MKSSKYPETILIRGVVVEGIGESSYFTCLLWVKEQFISRLRIDPFPGTFNLEIRDLSSLSRLRKIKQSDGVEIAPAEPGFCPAKGFPVLVNGKIKGALVIPQVPHYPEGKVEIIARQNIRKTLSLKNGDAVTVKVFLANYSFSSF